MKKKKSRIIALLLGTALACAMAGVLTACGGEDETAYKPGDVVIDSNDVKYTINEDGNVIEKEYSGKDITVKYLLDNNSYVMLEGRKTDDLALTKYVGDLTEVSLKTIEENVKIEDESISITSIGEKAFYGCDTLEKLDLSKSAKSLSFDIAGFAFAYCTSLQTVTLPDTVYVDYNKIGEGAFAFCENLTDITIGEKFATVGTGAFAYCSSLRSVALSPKQKVIEEFTFAYCDELSNVTFSDEIRSIKESAFTETAISNLDLSKYSKLRYIGANAFTNTKLSSVTLPDSVTYVGNHAFYNCYDLTTLNIPFIGNTIATTPTANSFTSIYGIDAREERDTPVYPTNPDETPTVVPDRYMNVTVKAVTQIPNSLFYGCDYLQSLNIQSYVMPDTYFVYGENGIERESSTVKAENISKIVGNSAFNSCANLSSVTLPSDTEEIGAYAFKDCSSLRTFNYPTALEAIGNNAFENCYELGDAAYPASLKTIGSDAFRNCYALRTVNITISVTSIGAGAFSGCVGITTVNVAKANGIITEKDNGYIYNQEYYSLGPVASWFDSNLSTSGSSQNNVTTVTIGSAHTIPAYMFRGLTNLTNVNITLNDWTDEEMDYVRYHEISDAGSDAEIGNYAFAYCSGLTASNLTINDNDGILTRIGDGAFQRCERLTTYTVSANVTSMGNGVFADCIALNSLTVENFNNTDGGYLNTLSGWFSSSTTYNDYGYEINQLYRPAEDYSAPYIPSSLRTVTLKEVCQLPNNMFNGWTNLNTLNITFRGALSTMNGNTYRTSIGNNALRNLDYVTLNIEGANNVKEIGTYAFANSTNVNCDLVNSFTRLIKLDNYAFANCNLSGTVNLPATLETLGNYVFFNNANIYTLNIGNYTSTVFNNNRSLSMIFGYSGSNVPSYGYVDEYDFVAVGSSYVPKALTTVTISGLDNLAVYSGFLSNMSYLEVVALSCNTSEPYYYMTNSGNPFAGCTSLKKVFLPDSVESIYLANNASLWGTTDLTSYFEIGNLNGETPIVYTYVYSPDSISNYGNYWTDYYDEYRICSHPTTTNNVTVTFNYGSGISQKSVTATEGTIEAAPETPVNNGYTVVGYYTSTLFSGAPVSFPYFSTSDRTLYAKWVANDTAFVEYPNADSTNFNVSEHKETNGVTLYGNGSSNAGYTVNVWQDCQVTGTVSVSYYTSVELSIATLSGTTARRTISAYSSSLDNIAFSYKLKAGETFTVSYSASYNSSYAEINLTFGTPTAITAPVIPGNEPFTPNISEIVGNVTGSSMTEEEFNQAIEELFSDGIRSYRGDAFYYAMGFNLSVTAQYYDNGNMYLYVTSDSAMFGEFMPMYITEEYGTQYLYVTYGGRLLIRFSDDELRENDMEEVADQLKNICDGVIPDSGLKTEFDGIDVSYDAATGTCYVVAEGRTQDSYGTWHKTATVVTATNVNGDIRLCLALYMDEELATVIRYTGINSSTVERPNNYFTPDDMQ